MDQASAVIKVPCISNGQPEFRTTHSNQLITCWEETQVPGPHLRNIKSRSQGYGEECVCITGFPGQHHLQTRSGNCARIPVFLWVFSTLLDGSPCWHLIVKIDFIHLLPT